MPSLRHSWTLAVIASVACGTGCCLGARVGSTTGGIASSGASSTGGTTGTACSSDASCSAGLYCAESQGNGQPFEVCPAGGANCICTPRQANGFTCSAYDQCLSRSCPGGLCAACTGNGSCATAAPICANGICMAQGATSGASASNGGTAGASNGASNGGSASNGGTAGASNGASNGGGTSSGGSNGGASCTSASQCLVGTCIAGVCGSDCTVPQFVTTNIELTTVCHPWLIDVGGTDVEGPASPVLTIDPGVSVSVAPDAYLLVGANSPGALQVNGTAAKPVTIAGATQTAGSWAGIIFGQNTTSSALAFTTVSYAGGTQPGLVSGISYPGAIMVYSDSTPALLVSLQNVTVQDNAANGFVFAGTQAGLAAGSSTLTASDWFAGTYPFVIDANQAGTLPITLQVGSGSGTPYVALACQGNQDCGNPLTVDHNETWPALPMAYAILGTIGVNVEGASSVATLTIAAPNTFEFADQSALQVDGLILGQGELVANGTATHHIVFKSIDTAPAFNAWQGFQLVAASANALQGTSLTYCDISDAMGFTVAVQGVPGNVSGEVTVNGSLFTQTTDAGVVGPVIANCTFQNYGSCGIFTEQVGDTNTYGLPDGGAAGNTFTPAANTSGDGQFVGDVCSI